MTKQKYVKKRRMRRRPWYEAATERAMKRKLPQQWEQIVKKIESELKEEV